MSNEDKRSAPRVFYPCEVQCYGVGIHALNPRIADVSVTGAFVDTVSALPSGAVLTLSFALNGQPLTVKAEVAHSMNGIGMGVRFVDLDDEQRSVIERFVADRSIAEAV